MYLNLCSHCQYIVLRPTACVFLSLHTLVKLLLQGVQPLLQNDRTVLQFLLAPCHTLVCVRIKILDEPVYCCHLHLVCRVK